MGGENRREGKRERKRERGRVLEPLKNSKNQYSHENISKIYCLLTENLFNETKNRANVSKMAIFDKIKIKFSVRGTFFSRPKQNFQMVLFSRDKKIGVKIL